MYLAKAKVICISLLLSTLTIYSGTYNWLAILTSKSVFIMKILHFSFIFMSITFLVWTLQCTKFQKFTVLPWRLDLPQNSKCTRIIWILQTLLFIGLGIYNFSKSFKSLRKFNSLLSRKSRNFLAIKESFVKSETMESCSCYAPIKKPLSNLY